MRSARVAEPAIAGLQIAQDPRRQPRRVVRLGEKEDAEVPQRNHKNRHLMRLRNLRTERQE
eukprot:4111394-Amphidinium_carterae.1